jgi:hypothetical protein
MLSYPRRLQSGQITCYLNRTYHALTTDFTPSIDNPKLRVYLSGQVGKRKSILNLSFTSEGASTRRLPWEIWPSLR